MWMLTPVETAIFLSVIVVGVAFAGVIGPQMTGNARHIGPDVDATRQRKRALSARKHKSLARNNKTRRWCSASGLAGGFDGPTTEIPAPPKRSCSAWGNHG